MTAGELIRAATNLAFFAVFAATAWAFVRRPRRDRAMVALLFALPTAAVALGLLRDAVGLIFPSFVTAILVMAIPFVTLSAVADLTRVPAAALRLALVGLVGTAVVAATLPEDGSRSPAVVLLVAYFFAVEAYAAWLAVQAARRARGVTASRLIAVAAGSFLLGAALLVVVVPPLASLVQLFALFAAIAYYVGFATPSALRRAWQTAGLREFIRVAAGAARLPSTTDALAELARGCAAVLGAPRATAAVRTADGSLLIVAADRAIYQSVAPEVPVGGSAMETGEPVIGAPRRDATWAAGMSVALAAPIVVGEERLGFVSVFAERDSLFLDEDLAMLQLLADQAAVVLRSRTLYDDLRHANEELDRRLTELNAVNQELSAFAYSVSHDLRAPLRSLDGFSAALLERYSGTLDDTGQRYLGFVRESSVEMGQLIDDLLRLSLVTRSEMHFEEVDLSALAGEIIARLRRAEPDRAARITIEPGLVVVADRALMRAALENLLGNAWKFTSKRAVAEIAVGRVEAGRQTFFVRDNGAGFDMRYTGKLFGAFQRLHAKDEFPGTGIGLATVQRVVRRHGGDVWATSELDRGTTFYFALKTRSERATVETPARDEEAVAT